MASTTTFEMIGSEPVEQAPEAARTLTLETALWLLLGLLALGMRLAALDRWPLSEGEATLAYEAWRFSAGLPYELPPGISPLLFNGSALVFWLFGASDLAARTLPVVGGSALVVAPWLLRPLLGRGQALAMAALLALSPTVLFWSRQGTGEVWGALAALLIVAGVARWARWGARRDGLLAAVALGVGLASTPGIWSLLVAGGLWLAWQRRRTGEGLPLVPALGYAGVALATFLVSATALFVNLPGLGAALELPIAWLRGLFGAGAPLALPFLFTLLLYEGLLVVAGLLGATRMIVERPRWAQFALLWLVLTLLPATIFNSGWAGGLLWVVLPLALLASRAVAALIEAVLAEGRALVEGFSLVAGLGLFLYFWINLAAYLAAPSTLKLVSLLLPPLMVLLLGGLIAGTYGAPAARRAMGLTLLMLGGIVSLSTAWGLSVVRGADPREPMVVQPGDATLRTAAAQLAQISVERHRDPAVIPLAIQRSLGYGPRWSFRGVQSVTLVEGSHPELPEAALLDAAQPAPPGTIGQPLWLGSEWRGPVSERGAFLRWLKGRSDRDGLTPRAGVLYVRIDNRE